MGLYVARRITDLLGGSIAVSSRIGVGSTFQVWLPVASCASTGVPARPASDSALSGILQERSNP
jgi:hypothetical protein